MRLAPPILMQAMQGCGECASTTRSFGAGGIMKKASIVGIILLLAALRPLPARAVLVNSWSGFTTAWDFWPTFGVPLEVNQDISAPAGAGNLGTWSPFGTSVWLDGYSLNGGGTNNVFWVNSGFPLDVTGGTITNQGSTTVQTITNNGQLTLSSVTLENGINQSNQSWQGTTWIGAPQDPDAGTDNLNGNNYITVGTISFAPGTTRATLNFNGGVITSGVKIDVEGSLNSFNITGGNVTYAPVGGVYWWQEGGKISLSGTGTLTLDDITHDTLNTVDQAGDSIYNQTGGTLNLTNGADLTLHDSSSTITGGTVTIDNSTLNFYDGSTANAACVTMDSGQLAVAENASFTAPSALTLTSGSLLQGGTVIIGWNGNVGNSLTVGSGATITSGATVDLYQGNIFNVAGGNATLTNSDTWAGNVNVTGGTLNLLALNYSDSANSVFKQTGGVLNLTNGASVTLSNPGSITTNGSGSGTTTVNIGTATGNDGSGLTLTNGSTLQTANASDKLIVNVGTSGSNASTGNTLNIIGGILDSSTQLVLNPNNRLLINGGSATLNGTGAGADTWEGDIFFYGGTLTLDDVIHNTQSGSYTQTGGILNLSQESALTLNSTDLIADNMQPIINIGTSPSDTGNSLNINGAQINGNIRINVQSGNQLNVSSGSINSNVQLGIDQGGSLNISGGSVAMGHYSSWAGSINLSGTGSLTFTNFGNHYLSTLQYTQSGAGTSLSVLNSTFGLPTNSYINNGSVTVADGSEMVLQGGSLTTAGTGSATTTVNIGTATGNDGSSLVVGTGSTLATAHSGDTLDVNIGTATSTGNSLLIDGGTLAPSATVVINANNSLDVEDGNATLNGSGPGTDTWTGTVNLSGGTLNLDSMVSQGTLNQTGGTIIEGPNTTLTLLNGSNLSGGILEVEGYHHFSNSLLTTVGTQFTGNGYIFKDGTGNTVFTADDSGFTGTYTQISGTTTIENNFFSGTHHFLSGIIDINPNGALTLASPDTWEKADFLITGGTLTLNNFSHDSTSASTNGTLNQTSGTTRLLNGGALTLDDNSSFLGGSFVDDGVLNISTVTGQTFGASLSGNGVFNKDGQGTMLFTGMNSAYTGDLYINAGIANFTNAQSYIKGATYLDGGYLGLSFGADSNFSSPLILSHNSIVILNTNGYNVSSSSNDVISSEAGQNNYVIKEGSGTYSVQTNNAAFDYNLWVKQGTMQVTSNGVTFNDLVAVGQGPGNPVSSLDISADTVTFNKGLYLSNGYMYVAGGGFNVTSGGLTVGSTINTINGSIATNYITGNLDVGPSGVSRYMIDVSPSTGTSDKYDINGNITTDNPGGIIDISKFAVVGPITDARKIPLTIFQATGTIDPSIEFAATSGMAASPFAEYTLSSQGNGLYDLNWAGYNPLAFRGQVVTEAAYEDQLTINNYVFDHIDFLTQQDVGMDKPEVSSKDNNGDPLPQNDPNHVSFWLDPYGNFETLHLSQGINVTNNMYGTLMGADLTRVDLGCGLQFMPTVYFGYVGGYEQYSGIDMYQNGFQGGVVGTVYKGAFMSSLLVNVGSYSNNMNVTPTDDNTSSWFAGVASRSAYNIGLTSDLTLQPDFLLSYDTFGGQNWNSSFGDLNMTSNMLNGFNVGPGLNVILAKKTWSVYATSRAMINVADGTSGTIGNFALPTLKMGTAYFDGGIGFTKRVKDRLSVYVQSDFMAGQITGYGFQGGLHWHL